MRWRRIVEVMVAGAIALPAAAEDGVTSLSAIPRATTATQAAGDTPLHLAVVLNQVPHPRVLPFVSRDGRLLAGPDTLRALGFAAAADATAGLLPLDAIPGVEVRFDSARQHVAIEAPLSQLSLDTTRVGWQQDPMQARASASPRGVLLNYDIYASHTGDGTQLTTGTELRVFGVAGGILRNTAVLRSDRLRADSGDGVDGALAANGGRWRHASVRLDTDWRFSFPESAVSLTIGDTLTGFVDWSRPVRLGGLRVGRDFGLQPYRVTSPLPVFPGEVALPSEVELYVDGLRQYQGSLPVGPFEMTTLPGISGAGHAQVVITDAFGRVRTLDFPFYATQRLLAEGLSDWSLAVGRVRDHYGIDSFAYYGDTIASATLRRGVSDRITLELQAEGGGGLRNAGVGGAWLLGMAGVLSVSHVRSRIGDASGGQSAFAYNWQPGRLHLSLQSQRSHGDYRDIAALYAPAPPTRTDRALLGFTGRAGSLNLSYLRLDRSEPDTLPARYAGAFWNRSFDSGWSANLSLNQNLDDRRDRSLFVSVLIPLARQRQASIAVQRQQASTQALLDVSQPIPGDGGLGWRTQLRLGDAGGGLVEAGWLHDHGRLMLGAGRFDDLRQAYAQADGALVWMGGGLFPARRVDDAFAVVSTDGFANVPVTLEHRIIGSTDARGHLLVTPLRAWQQNRLGLDPMALPADVRVDEVSQLTVPQDRAGVSVRFPVIRVRAALLVLHDADGQPLAMGSRAVLAGTDGTAGQAIVGYDGIVYLEGLEGPGEQRRVRVHMPDGRDCEAGFALPPAGHAVPRLGPLTCVSTQATP
ncbi:fimbria/pilus outer membrane usher protein [Luteimonas sp. RIT-PG2_3]